MQEERGTERDEACPVATSEDVLAFAYETNNGIGSGAFRVVAAETMAKADAGDTDGTHFREISS